MNGCNVTGVACNIVSVHSTSIGAVISTTECMRRLVPEFLGLEYDLNVTDHGERCKTLFTIR